MTIRISKYHPPSTFQHFIGNIKLLVIKHHMSSTALSHQVRMHDRIYPIANILVSSKTSPHAFCNDGKSNTLTPSYMRPLPINTSENNEEEINSPRILSRYSTNIFLAPNLNTPFSFTLCNLRLFAPTGWTGLHSIYHSLLFTPPLLCVTSTLSNPKY